MRHQQDARVQVLGAVRLRERLLPLAPRVRQHVVVRSPDGARASARPGRRSPNSSCERTARSNATHAITFEWVKWRSGPRTSQMPVSCCRHPSSSQSSSFRISDQTLSSAGAPCDAQLVDRVEDLAVDIELELRRRGVADPHGGRPLVARQPVELALVQAALPREPVHDLDVGGVAGDGAQEPLAPRLGLLARAGLQHREERQRGVAQPAEAVVPVALAADPLGQRRGRRGDDPAGRRVRHRLQHDQRLVDLLVVVAGARQRRRPSPASTPRSRASARSASTASGMGSCDGNHVEHEPQTIALGQRELRDRGHVLAVRLDGRPEAQRVRTGDGDERVVDPADPRDDAAVVEPDHQLEPHRHAAGQALDDPHDVGRVSARRHEVDHAHRALVGLVARTPASACRDGSAGHVARTASRARGASGRCPAAPSSAAKHAPESNRGKQHQSIDPSRLTSAAVCRSPISA